MTKLRRLLLTPPADLLLIARAWVLFAYVDWMITRRPYERWPAWMRIDGDMTPGTEQAHRKSSPEVAPTDEYHLALRVVRLSEVAGRYHVRQMNCLRRCLAQRALLSQRGVVPELHFGVRALEHGIAAHSWLTLNRQVLNDSEDVTCRYVQLGFAARRAVQLLSASGDKGVGTQ